ncbi:transposase InsO family protein [Bradyrhizobium elkanii]|nr:transposase InsO family protein [Bradyrhizobium elkanii]
MFDMRRQENGIEHRLTKVKCPLTNGRVERMNRTIKEATIQRYRYDQHDQLEADLCWISQPEQFKLNPLQQMPGLNT